MRERTLAATIVAITATLCQPAILREAAAADWPAYGHDSGRGGATVDELKCPLNLQWVYAPSSPPSPAWPEPGKELHPMPFDYAFQAVVAGGTVYFGSSADDTVYALDAANGREKWHFRTGGPVRFAPAVAGERVFAASDDGHIYSLAAATGKPLWDYRCGPSDEMIFGNENMISRWPPRSGLVVEDGVVYATAGFWPSEGVRTIALRAADASVLWQRESADGFAPQGYLAANREAIVAPAGRANAWVIARADGQVHPGGGNSWAIVSGSIVLSGPAPDRGNDNLAIKDGIDLPGKNRSITIWDIREPKRAIRLAGRQCAAVDGNSIYAGGGGKVGAYEFLPSSPQPAAPALPAAAAGRAKPKAVGAGPLGKIKNLWEVPWEGNVFSLIVAGSSVVLGGENVVTILDRQSGQVRWSAKVDGEARALAVADGRLIVGTHTGRIACFSPARAGAEKADGPEPSPLAKAPADPRAKAILDRAKVAAGFCMIQGIGDGKLAMALAAGSDLRICCAEPDAAKVAAAREAIAAAGLYGTRITVHHVASTNLPYPDYFADLVIAADGSAPYTPAELCRILRPCGGVLAALPESGLSESKIKASLGAAGETGAELTFSSSADGLRVVRGPLPGAGQWTHEYGDAGKSGSSGDTLVKAPLKVLWFGKPGPQYMMNRHWRGTSPVCVNGRMFVLGQHCVIAVDAYNGRQLWTRQMQGINRRAVDIRGGNMAADANSVYVVTGDQCLRLDAATGQTTRVYRLPLARPRYSLARQCAFKMNDLGSITLRNTPEAMEISLDTADDRVVNASPDRRPTFGDSWELFFDFRPAAIRTGLYGPGAFQLIVVPARPDSPTPIIHAGLWSQPVQGITVAATPCKTGTCTVVRVPWAEVARSAGGQGDDFAFGAILNSSDDGEKLTKRTYRFANSTSFRLANAQATISLRGPAKDGPAPGPGDIVCEDPEQLTWGNLTIVDGLVIGTTVARTDVPADLSLGLDYSSQNQDYTGPPIAKVLGSLGVADRATHVFALGLDDGRTRWVHTPARGLGHDALAACGGRVYLIDRTDVADTARAARRGETPQDDSVIDELDLHTGKPVAQIGRGRGHVGLRIGQGVLLATDLNGMTAYDALSGKELWSVSAKQAMHHCSAHLRIPVIAGDWVYDEPYAYNLRTGKTKTLPGQDQPWRWGGFRGCGTVSGAQNMLFYRSATGNPGLLDAAGADGNRNFQGLRPGCFINIIAAGGLVLMPEASSGCGCAYNFQTTLTLMPAAPKARSPSPARASDSR
jgi:outer membrane protein assembly factor BamB